MAHYFLQCMMTLGCSKWGPAILSSHILVHPQMACTLVFREQLGISVAATAITGALTWLGWVDACCADHLWEGGSNRDLDGALLSGWEVLCGGLLVVLWHWLVVLWRQGQWSLDGRRLNVLTGQDIRTSETRVYSSQRETRLQTPAISTTDQTEPSASPTQEVF